MRFDTEKEAQLYALKVTSKHATEADLRRNITDYRRYQELHSNDPEERVHWRKQEEANIEYLNSEQFQSGKYHIGIDELILDVIEFRAIVYSFSVVELTSNPFEKFTFHRQWLAGGTYKVFASYGKLLSGHKDDQSLKNVWNNVSSFIGNTALSSNQEVADLTEFIVSIKNNSSKAFKFRNKAIAHNEQQPKVTWEDLDNELMVLCRVWDLISRWCSIGIIAPYATDHEAFSGLEPFVSSSELIELKKARRKYIKQVCKWCKEEYKPNKQFKSDS
ncbi:hypothetical protein V6472_004651 [Vibrio parahaemolyticus]